MYSTTQNLAISAAGILILLVFTGIFSARELASALTDLEAAAFQLGQQEAEKKLEASAPYFLAVSHGWGLDQVPGIHAEGTAACIIQHLPVEKFRELTDIPFHEWEQLRVDVLRNVPHRSLEFAAGFNSIMFKVMDAQQNICF